MAERRFVPHRPERLAPEEMQRRADAFFELMDRRRSVRDFSPRPVPRRLIETAIRTASAAPSGAHRQPWKFVAVDDAQLKREMRQAAEVEERKNYDGRFPPEWLEAVAPLGTGWEKPHITDAPWVVVVFEELYGVNPDGSKRKNYYVKESVGIACGFFIAALHTMGLVTLTHTPSPMGFLRRLLGRPDNERPYILFPIGYPTEETMVPDLVRKPLAEVAIWNPRPGGTSDAS